MLTRLKVNGFKNLVDIDISFGPFTCIAGPNSVGKSNLFDAITFLSALASKPLLEAAVSVRSELGAGADVTSIFHRASDRTDEEMSFEAEMLIPKRATDDLGQEAEASATFLRYKLVLGLSSNNSLAIRAEGLDYINKGEARSHLRFPHSPKWRNTVVENKRFSPLISTREHEGKAQILLHLDIGKGFKGGGRPRPHLAERLPRTVLQSVNAAEHATAVVARREMQSWRLLQLEPSALRAPDPFTAPTTIATNGAHLPATLARLAGLRTHLRRIEGSAAAERVSAPAAALYARVANRLAELTEGVRSICVEVDSRRELLTLVLTDLERTEYEARSLSDGTLRFLALTVLEADPEARGVLCLEEPENGIHPLRIPAMLHLLQDLAVNPNEPDDRANPLRQVIVNTHSPAVAGQVPADALLVAMPQTRRRDETLETLPVFRWLPDTWRAKEWPEVPTVPMGTLYRYLSPIEPEEAEGVIEPGIQRRPRRVVDRQEFQIQLPFAGAHSQT